METETKCIRRGSRIARWDNLKALLIFLVVVGHVFWEQRQYFWVRGMLVFIYTFHMPLFVFLAGMLGRKTVNRKRYGKIFAYLLLYLMLQMIRSFVRLAVYGKTSFHILEVHGYPWFAWAMFVFFLMTIAVRRLKGGYVLGISILLACFVAFNREMGDKYALSRIIVFYPFFYTGYKCRESELREVLSEWYVKCLSLVGVALFLILCMLLMLPGENEGIMRLLLGRPIAGKFTDIQPWCGLIRLGYYAAAYGVSFMIMALVPSRKITFITEHIGARSLQIYGLHYALVIILVQSTLLPQRLQSAVGIWWAPVMLGVSLLIMLICSLRVAGYIFLPVSHPEIMAAETKQ